MQARPAFIPRVMNARRMWQHKKLSMSTFEEYAAKRASFEPNAPRVGPTAAQSPIPNTVWPNYYCAPDLQRSGRETALESADARFVLVWQGKNLFKRRAENSWDIALLDHEEAHVFTTDSQAIMIFLGQYNGQHIFGLDVSHLQEFTVPGHEDAVFEQLRSIGGLLVNDHDAGLLASARGMAVWHRSTLFCANCGSGDMKAINVGTSRKCGSCGARVFPRTDPSVIVAVSSADNEHLLMGRKAAWPKGRYSTLAGFSEMGESLEECVVREVEEESGILVNPSTIRFCSSQPWPFPRSLMIGFHASAKPTGTAGSLPSIKIQEEEMEDVQVWHI